MKRQFQDSVMTGRCPRCSRSSGLGLGAVGAMGAACSAGNTWAESRGEVGGEGGLRKAKTCV